MGEALRGAGADRWQKPDEVVTFLLGTALLALEGLAWQRTGEHGFPSVQSVHERTATESITWRAAELPPEATQKRFQRLLQRLLSVYPFFPHTCR